MFYNSTNFITNVVKKMDINLASANNCNHIKLGARIIKTTTYLKNDLLFVLNKLHNNIYIDLTLIDNLDFKLRYSVIYILMQIKSEIKMIFKVGLKYFLNPIIQTMSNVYYAIGVAERECYDLFGLFFNNHPDLRRIVTDYGFRGNPLKKDFPLTGTVELFYSIIKKILIFKPIKLIQEMRTFNYESPWVSTDADFETPSKTEEEDDIEMSQVISFCLFITVGPRTALTSSMYPYDISSFPNFCDLQPISKSYFKKHKSYYQQHKMASKAEKKLYESETIGFLLKSGFNQKEIDKILLWCESLAVIRILETNIITHMTIETHKGKKQDLIFIRLSNHTLLKFCPIDSLNILTTLEYYYEPDLLCLKNTFYLDTFDNKKFYPYDGESFWTDDRSPRFIKINYHYYTIEEKHFLKIFQFNTFHCTFNDIIKRRDRNIVPVLDSNNFPIYAKYYPWGPRYLNKVEYKWLCFNCTGYNYLIGPDKDTLYENDESFI